MIKSFTLFTDEIDDTQYAVEQITQQLQQSRPLLKNTIGIISCYADFVQTGTYQAICDALDFEIIGATSILSTTPDSDADILLSVMVLTSDDVSFATGLSSPIEKEDTSLVTAAYQSAAAKLDCAPSLILSYAPLLMNVSGDFFATVLDEISNGVPNFGTLAVDHTEDYQQSRVLYNGRAYADQYAFVLLGGDVHPRYYVASISNEKIFQEKGVVTASCGNQLQTVNNMPVADYLVGLGMKKEEDGSITGINSFPFLMDQNDGMMPIVRVMFALTPEGYAVCGGNIPVGATLSVGSINADEVLETTRDGISQVITNGNYDCLLMYSCVGRYFALGYNPQDEIEKVKSLLNDTGIPYHFAYSGCEICPVYSNDTALGNTINRSHNDTLVICAL